MSKPTRKRSRWPLILFVVLIAGLGYGYWWVTSNIAPANLGQPPVYVRYEVPTALGTVLGDLEKRGVVRNRQALRLYATLKRLPGVVQTGTYTVSGGMSGPEVLQALEKPVRQMVRIPQTNWSLRTANLLEQKGVLKADDYNRLVASPQEFKGAVSFPLPDKSLEGYLYPDTYDLPPLLGAKETILRQLKAFERKVWTPLNRPANLHRVLTVASMVELEVARDEERPVVAGVIENRLQKGIPLQIDSTVLFAMGHWKSPSPKELRTFQSPYNTYLNKGLPPGPVCSPSVKSIEAALHPAKHSYLYYLAIHGKSLFAATYPEHLKNVALLRKAAAEDRKAANAVEKAEPAKNK